MYQRYIMIHFEEIVAPPRSQPGLRPMAFPSTNHLLTHHRETERETEREREREREREIVTVVACELDAIQNCNS